MDFVHEQKIHKLEQEVESLKRRVASLEQLFVLAAKQHEIDPGFWYKNNSELALMTPEELGGPIE